MKTAFRFDYKSVNFNAKIADTGIDCDVMSPHSLLFFHSELGEAAFSDYVTVHAILFSLQPIESRKNHKNVEHSSARFTFSTHTAFSTCPSIWTRTPFFTAFNPSRFIYFVSPFHGYFAICASSPVLNGWWDTSCAASLLLLTNDIYDILCRYLFVSDIPYRA